MDFCFPEFVPWLSHWTWHHLWRRRHLASFTETAAMPSNAAGLSQLIKTCRWFKRGAVWITWTISASVNRYSPAPPTLPNLAASASWYVCHTNLHYSLFSHGSEAQKSCTHVPCASHLCSENIIWFGCLCCVENGWGLGFVVQHPDLCDGCKPLSHGVVWNGTGHVSYSITGLVYANFAFLGFWTFLVIDTDIP